MTPTQTRTDPIFDPAAVAQRVAYLAHSVVGHFARTDRNKPGVMFDTRAVTKLQDVASAWHGAQDLDADDFRKRFFDSRTSDATVEGLRKAIQGAAKAETYAELGAASKALATAMATIGMDRWPGLLARLSARATAGAQ
jgi:hypothetical protein